MILSDRQWHQCKAALVFWRAVADSSRVHPSQHPKVRGMFGDGKPSPLTDAEIREVLRLQPVQEGTGHTIKAFAAAMGVSARSIYHRLKWAKCKPAGKIGNTGLYSLADLRWALRHIRPREKKDYAVPAIQPT